MAHTVGSILHGAYGDYYWQATALRMLKKARPDIRLRLFAASAARMEVMRHFDFSFAESFELWPALESCEVDEFVQYQVFDPDLKRDVLARLPLRVLSRIDQGQNRIFWRDLMGKLPLSATDRLQLNEAGRRMTEQAMEEYGIDSRLFEKRPTIGFVWRYRVASSAIKPVLQPSAEQLVEKYSKVFRRLIETHGCHVLITGMNVVTNDENRPRIDAKYAQFGLDLPREHCTYMQGRNWVADVEILSRCRAAALMASGISEAIDTHRGGGALVLDPPLHYMLVFLKYRIGLFQFQTLRGKWRMLTRPHSAGRLYHWLASALQ